MTNNKKLFYLASYFCMATLLGLKVIQTVYANSLFVHTAHELSSLNTQKMALIEENSELNTQLSRQNSLYTLVSSDTLNQYTDITNPIVITDGNLVALK